MFPPTQNLDLDMRAISGITGSISIACWVIVFSPQIIVNFRRSSGDGLSLTFLVIWLLGDVFNVLGAVLQGVLPTMLILAAYYTLADIVLLGQCLYYSWRDHHIAQNLLPRPVSAASSHHHHHHHIPDVAHLSPATPLLDPPKPGDDDADLLLARSERPLSPRRRLLNSILLNTSAVIMVVTAGVFGWYLTPAAPDVPPPSHDPTHPPPVQPFSPLGQVFGYLCAFLYLSSRLPQIYHNHRRQTVEGLSLLFFLFACLGNLTYVVSILAYVPPGAASRGHERWDPRQRAAYARYLAVNASWLLGSVGTLALDMVIFVQFFLYRDLEIDDEEEVGGYDAEEEVSVGRFYDDGGEDEEEEDGGVGYQPYQQQYQQQQHQQQQHHHHHHHQQAKQTTQV